MGGRREGNKKGHQLPSTRIWRLGCDDAKMQDRGRTGAGREVKAGTKA